jgi:hypothetical protein
MYLAGADPFLDDRFGRLKLTRQGLQERSILATAASWLSCAWLLLNSDKAFHGRPCRYQGAINGKMFIR